MISRPKREGKIETVKLRRRQKRKRRRLVEANDPDWARFDAAAILSGLNFAEFARRALGRAADSIEARNPVAFEAARVRAAAALASESE